MEKIEAERDDVAPVTAREFLTQAFEHAAEARDAAEHDLGATEDYHETRELTSLFYSVATSLADIADALRSPRPEVRIEASPVTPPAVYDGDGDRWLNFPGTSRYGLVPHPFATDGLTLDEIRGAYGLRD